MMAGQMLLFHTVVMMLPIAILGINVDPENGMDNSFLLSETQNSNVTQVKIDWSKTIAVSRLTNTLQVVVSPLLRRQSPVYATMWQMLAELEADYVRYVPWLPYPRLGVAELEPPSGSYQCQFITGTQNTSEVLHLSCGAGVVAEVLFASFGNPTGFCEDLKVGSCHAQSSQQVVEKTCVGQESCTLLINSKTFGSDPCPGQVKGFAVKLLCKPATINTYWDFSLIDPMTEDFMNATQNHSVIINFSITPEWMYKTPDRVKYPDDPNEHAGVYQAGTELIDPKGLQVADYYGRLVSWYTQGGFKDEYGVEHQSPYHYDFQYWECLNEVDLASEHSMTPESYTHLYDQMVLGIRRHADPEKKMKFVGLALGGYQHDDWYRYFLNRSNHVSPDIPLDIISFHFYAHCKNRTDPINYQDFFPQVDQLVAGIEDIVKIRDALSPGTKLDLDEAGIILPDDNSPDAPMFPLVYWNAAGALYAYFYGKLAATGLDILGQSTLVGNPSLPELRLQPFFPSCSMLNWTNGLGNARYHVLKTLIANFKPGDKLVGTEILPANSNPSQPAIGSSEDVFVQAFTAADGSNHRVLVVNKSPEPQQVTVPGVTGSTAFVIDETRPTGPAEEITLTSDTLSMMRYAVFVVIPKS